MRQDAVAVASESTAEEAAQAYLRAGGDAVGAVIAGFFAAAGHVPGVLFGPLSLLTAQVGAGARAFDGRQKQPGLELRRPKGLGPEETPVSAARVGVPGSVAALLVALRYSQSVSLGKVLSPGIALAKQAGCERRAEVLEQIQRLGPAALAAPSIARPLIHRAGPSEGGGLGTADLAAISEIDHPARVLGSSRVVPWYDERLDAQRLSSYGGDSEWASSEARQQGLCARDSRGGLAALCYDHASVGFLVEELELLLPFSAIPARRGVTRVAPGSFLPAPAPLAIEFSPGAVPITASIQLGARGRLVVHAAE
jgi:hypothetical protein